MDLLDSNENPVIVAPATAPGIANALRGISNKPFSWIYLGQSIAGYRITKGVLGKKGIEIDVTQRFHQTSDTLREPYLSYVSEIGRKLDSLNWWITSVAQKNSYICKTYHQLCYLSTAIEVIKSNEPANILLIIAADQPVRTAIKLNLTERHHRHGIALRRFCGSIGERILNVAQVLTRRVYFVAREIRRLFHSNLIMPKLIPQHSQITILMSYLTPSTIKKGARFHEDYFGDLAADFTSTTGRPLFVLPIVLREIPFREAMIRLKEAEYPIMLPYHFLRFTDILWSAINSLSRPPKPHSWPSLANIDISPLLDHELEQYWISNRAADTLLTAAFIKRLHKKGIDVSEIIFVFENQPWERAMCWQVRNSLPAARAIGYQHARVPLNMLNFYPDSSGEPHAPQPDWVVTVGEHSADLLSRNGHAPNRVRIGGALQMQEIQRISGIGRRPESSESTNILITPSNGLEEAIELVETAINLAKNKDNIRVILKCHPLLPFSTINAIAEVSLPDRVTLSDRPVTDLMQECSVMIYSGSTVSVQGLLIGIPLIHLLPKFDFDMDPLKTVPDVRLQASNLDELETNLSWLMANYNEYVRSHQALWSETAEKIYGPVTASTVYAFLDQS